MVEISDYLLDTYLTKFLEGSQGSEDLATFRYNMICGAAAVVCEYLALSATENDLITCDAKDRKTQLRAMSAPLGEVLQRAKRTLKDARDLGGDSLRILAKKTLFCLMSYAQMPILPKQIHFDDTWEEALPAAIEALTEEIALREDYWLSNPLATIERISALRNETGFEVGSPKYPEPLVLKFFCGMGPHFPDLTLRQRMELAKKEIRMLTVTAQVAASIRLRKIKSVAIASAVVIAIGAIAAGSMIYRRCQSTK